MLARPEWKLLTVGTVALLISSGMNLAYPQAVKSMVESLLQPAAPGAVVSRGSLNGAAAALIGMFLVQSLFAGIRAWAFTVSGERVVARLRSELFAAIVGQDIAFFDLSRTGEMTSRLSSDTTVLQNTVTTNISMALRFGLMGLGALGLLLWTSPRLAGVTLAVVPVIAIAAAIYGRMLRGLSQRVQESLARGTEIAEEALSSIRTVRSFAREGWEILRYRRAVDDTFALATSRAKAVGAFSALAGLAGYCALALVVWYGGRLVLDQQMSVGDLTAFLIYTGTVGVSLGTLAGLYGDFMKAVGASERVFELLDRRALLEHAGGDTPREVRGEVVLHGVEFAYPSRPDVAVLRGVDLRIAPGEVVALVGPSGGGKSTIASLLLRFYDPGAGRVTLDGVDLRTLDPRALREKMAMVSQEPVLFAASIEENIRYGRPDAAEAEVQAAAQAANADDFISAFPEGYATRVGERGVQLSGGQKQRVAIARAILKDPPVLVLDEATSALDAESEHLVQEALERLMKGRTTLVIAHRLSTVQGADRVVVLDAGQVAESGTHAELVAKDGLYRRLVQRQFSEFKEQG